MGPICICNFFSDFLRGADTSELSLKRSHGIFYETYVYTGSNFTNTLNFTRRILLLIQSFKDTSVASSDITIDNNKFERNSKQTAIA
jgi:hypothetical protein